MWRGGGLGSRPKKMYGERLGDGVENHLMSPTPRRKWYLTTGRRAYYMVLDPIPQSLPVHFFGSRPQHPTSPCWTFTELPRSSYGYTNIYLFAFMRMKINPCIYISVIYVVHRIHICHAYNPVGSKKLIFFFWDFFETFIYVCTCIYISVMCVVYICCA